MRPSARRQHRRVFRNPGQWSEPDRSASSGGTGLGPAITREIVERHGGSIAVMATAPPGATFELRVPLTD